jgi:5-formyltetrahydrofolate cyclo-ligase
MSDSIGTIKNQLRKAVKDRMSKLSPEEYSGSNRAIHEQFFSLDRVKQASSIMIYYSSNGEAETASIIQELLFMGKTVSLPVCAPAKDLVAAKITDLSRLVTNEFGIKEPDPGRMVCPDFIDLIVLPGLAFDEAGFRLGRGAGYYDRFLSKNMRVFKLGLAYDFQVYPSLPVESHDIAIDGLITPAGYREMASYRKIGG